MVIATTAARDTALERHVRIVRCEELGLLQMRIVALGMGRYRTDRVPDSRYWQQARCGSMGGSRELGQHLSGAEEKMSKYISRGVLLLTMRQ